FKMPVGVSRRKKSCLVRFPRSHDLSTGDVLHLILEPLLYGPAHDPQIANRLQLAERFYLLLSSIDRATIIAVIIQNDRFAVLFSEVEEPAVPNRKCRQARCLRRDHRLRRRRISEENFLGCDLQNLFVISGWLYGGKRTNEDVGVPVGTKSA